jgi:hypothetical protein
VQNESACLALGGGREGGKVAYPDIIQPSSPIPRRLRQVEEHVSNLVSGVDDHNHRPVLALARPVLGRVEIVVVVVVLYNTS